jgi:hypothetical protein
MQEPPGFSSEETPRLDQAGTPRKGGFSLGGRAKSSAMTAPSISPRSQMAAQMSRQEQERLDRSRRGERKSFQVVKARAEATG